MIRVTIKKLRERNKNDWTESLAVSAANALAEQMATLLKKRVKEFKCDNHNPPSISIVVSANAKKMVSIKKSSPCCKEFSDKVQIDNFK